MDCECNNTERGWKEGGQKDTECYIDETNFRDHYSRVVHMTPDVTLSTLIRSWRGGAGQTLLDSGQQDTECYVNEMTCRLQQSAHMTPDITPTSIRSREGGAGQRLAISMKRPSSTMQQSGAHDAGRHIHVHIEKKLGRRGSERHQ